MNNRIKSRMNLVNGVLPAVMVSLLFAGAVAYASTIMRTTIPLSGTASGGTLVIGYGSRSSHFVSINTSQGESAESVVKRLAEAVAQSNRIFDFSRAAWEVDREALASRMAVGTKIQIKGRPYFLAGSDTGLGIPKAPLFLSCSYAEDSGEIKVRWVNPPGEYTKNDFLMLNWRYYRIRTPDEYPAYDLNGRYESTERGGADGFLGPDIPSSYIIKKPANVNDVDLDVWLTCFRNEAPVKDLTNAGVPLRKIATPSNVAIIHLTSNGFCQEETNGMPFFAGIAPNWAPWSTAAKVDKAAFEQGDKYPNSEEINPAWALMTKPFYQVIKAPPAGVVHGIYRKFLGLTPGRTYRLTAGATTLEMDAVKAGWSFSLHAAPTGPDAKDLTVQQLAGLAPLPDGSSGLQAGQIKSYGPGETTKGNFSLVFSGENPAAGAQGSNITLPAGVDAITVWVKFNCSTPNGKVGFSGVKLEDISAISDIKTTEQIRAEELHQVQIMR